MRYRVKTQRALKRVVPEEGLGAVRRAIRERNDGVALAMSFDPGTVSDLALYAHASAIMMGLLYARGWRRAQPQVHIDNAAHWPDRWWRDTLGPGAFVVETALSPHARCEVEDLTTITSLTALAWCMELDVCERERAMPDLMMAMAPQGVSLASIHHTTLGSMRSANRSTSSWRAWASSPKASRAGPTPTCGCTSREARSSHGACPTARVCSPPR